MTRDIVVDDNIPFAREAFGAVGRVRMVPWADITPALVREADALIVRAVAPVGRALLDNSRVRFVATATSGFDHVDTAFLRARGIGFASAPGCNAGSVGDYVMAALLSLHRRGKVRLDTCTVGLVGLGHTGGGVARRLERLGVSTLWNDPPLARAGHPGGFCSLDDLMCCDVISLHTPLHQTGPDATLHLFDESRLKRMKPTSVLINTARGEVVDTCALKAALKSGRLGGAVLDVWENEPNVDRDLLNLVDIGTAHIAGLSWDGRVNGAVMACEALCRHVGAPVTWRPSLDPVEPLSIDGCVGDDLFLSLDFVVRTAYDIEKDAQAFRSNPLAFNQIRDLYPPRRDFGALRVRGGDDRWIEKCKAVGFR